MSNTRPDKEMSFATGDWVVLKRWATEQIKSLQDKLCGINNIPTQDETNVLRGRIATLKQILEFETMAARERLAAGQTE